MNNKLIPTILAILMVACRPSTNLSITQNPTSPLENPTGTTTSSITPSKVSTPTSIPITIPDFYELPDWLDDPEASVFMYVSDINDQENTFELEFRNVYSQEYFAITLPLDIITGYFWLPDGKGFGLSGNISPIYFVDSFSGKVNSIPINSIKLLYARENLSPKIAESKNGTILIKDIYPEDNVSIDRKYVVTQYWDPIEVESVISGESIQITNPKDDLYDLEYSWHPKLNYLAVLHGIIPPYPSIGDRITIYKPTGEVIKTILFDTYIDYFEFSFDGELILFSKVQGSSDGWDYYQYPCLMNYYTEEVSCIFEIQRRHQKANLFRWALEKNTIGYFTNIEGNQIICFFDLSNGNENCPFSDSLIAINVQKNKELSPNFPSGFGNFSMSLDGGFAVVSSPTIGHFFPFPVESFVINIDSQLYFSLGFNDWDSDNDIYIRFPEQSLIWRPPITDE